MTQKKDSLKPVIAGSFKQLMQERPFEKVTVQMIAEITGYSAKTIRTWTAIGHIRWFRNGSKNYAPKELVLAHMMSEEYRSIANRSWKHDKLVQQLIDMTSEEGNGHE